MNIIEARELSYKYPFCDETSLSGISFTLEKGEAMLVTGASGCGKSTLLRILNGLIPNHFKGTLSGRLKVLNLEFPAPLRDVSERVGTVLQNPEEQIMATTVAEEVALALEWRSTPAPEIRDRVAASLDAFGLTPLADRSVFNLSSGERQKCVLAAVMASGADIVVMDEPTANLSPEATEDLARLCLAMKSRGITLVIVDHRLYWLRGVLDKLLVLKDGKPIWEGRAPARPHEPRATSHEPRPDVLDLLAAEPGYANWGLRSVDVKRPELEGCSSSVSEFAVEIKNLSFRYSRKGEWIYRDFSAKLPRGKITAIVGANGAGKTTLARLLCGLLKPTSGAISLSSTNYHLTSTNYQLRQRTAFVMQQMDIQLYMHSVEEELVFSAPRSVAKAERLKCAAHWMDVFGLSHLKDRHPHSLSGGEKQRLVVACALMKRPELLILDEPTSGLDGRNMRIIADVLREYVSSGGSALLITHDLELLQLVADCRLEVVKAEQAKGEG